MGFTDAFRYYLPPNEETVRAAMTSGLVVLDTNVLLSAYRFAPAARNELMTVLGRVADRIWIPNRVAEEFHKNRLEVISDYDAAYMPVVEALRQAQISLDNDLPPLIAQLANRALLSDEAKAKLLHSVASTTDAATSAIERLRTEHGLADVRGHDSILTQFQKLLDGKTGPPFDEEETNAAVAEARRRIEQQIPPGYRDAKKQEPYGDYFIWKQTIEEVARQESKYLVFVTLDKKDDWFWDIKGRTMGARPELTRELTDASGAQLVMFNVASFLFHAREYLNAEVSQETIRQSESLPRSDVERERLAKRAGAARQRRLSEIQELSARLESRLALIRVLETTLADRLSQYPDRTSIETRVVRTQLEHLRSSVTTLHRRLDKLRLDQMEDAEGRSGSTEVDSSEVEVEVEEEEEEEGGDEGPKR